MDRVKVRGGTRGELPEESLWKEPVGRLHSTDRAYQQIKISEGDLNSRTPIRTRLHDYGGVGDTVPDRVTSLSHL